MTLSVHSPNPKNNVVLRDGNRDGVVAIGCRELAFRHGGKLVGQNRPGPVRRREGSPHDLILRARGRVGRRVPHDLRVIEGDREHARGWRVLHAHGRRRRTGENRHGSGVQPRDAGDVVEVVVLDQVAVLHAVFDADVLVLVVEVLAPFGEADSGEAVLVEGGVVAAAEEAVAPEFENRVEARGGRRGGVGSPNVGDGAGKLAGGRVALITKRQDAPNLLRRSVSGDVFREDADSMRSWPLSPGV